MGNGGKACPNVVSPKACNTHPCPIDCVWEWAPWTPCTVTCGGGSQLRDLVIKQLAAHGGKDCPAKVYRVCNALVCPTETPTSAPTKAPTPTPASTPVIAIAKGDIITIDASKDGTYVDAGAVCSDEYDGILPVHAHGHVQVGTVGTYKIHYNCKNKRGYKADTAVRTVYVSDRHCPVCHLNGASVFTLEAGFAYADAGAYFEDAVDGKITKSIEVTNPLASAKDSHPGTYTVVYRVQDSAGNWNDGQCIGSNICQRKVVVQDTLKPVIALSYGKETIHVSKATDHPIHAPQLANPAVANFLAFMAEGPSSSMWGAWAIGSAACVGVALVAYGSVRRQAVASTDLGELV